MAPFRLHFTLSRNQRLAAEIYPWLPCLGACLGFTFGVAFLSVVVSRWFLPFFVLPPIVLRNFFAFLFGLAVHPAEPVEVTVEDGQFCVCRETKEYRFPLVDIFQVFRSEDGATWTVLNNGGAEVVIPAAAIAADQLDYLKGFARRAAEIRRAAMRDR